MQKIVRRAGLQPWPRLFHNLRASRETELVEKYPVQVVTGWLGNTPSVAMRHYLMTTQQHFDAALRDGEPLADHRDEKVAQKAAQQAHVVTRNEPQPASVAHEKTPVLPGFASGCDSTLPPGVVRRKPSSSRVLRQGEIGFRSPKRNATFVLSTASQASQSPSKSSREVKECFVSK
jgi:hypothetical protein